MKSEWKKYALGEVCARLSSGKNISAKLLDSTAPYPVYGGNGIRGYTQTLNFSGECALVGRQGVYCGNVRYFKGDAYITEHALVVQAKSEHNTRYLAYLLSLMQLGRLSAQSAQPGISVRVLSVQEVVLPSLPTQRKIAAILSSLDDKIENNNAICKNLEEQAAALYKSWFVDFEPFGGKKPQSWKEASLKDLVEIKYGKDHKKLNDGMVPVYGSGGEMRRVETAIYSDESVLIPRKGSLNNVIYASDPFWTVDTMFYTRMRINNVCKYVHQFIKRINLEGLNAGSAVPSMTTEILYSLKVHLPTYDVLDHFEALVKPMYEMRHCTMQQNITLASLRDALLPKLLSGEVEVDKVAI